MKTLCLSNARFTSQRQALQDRSPHLFDQFVIFGDSLTDPGNVYNVTRAANALIPGVIPISPQVPPYDSKGRITNGDPLGDPRSIWVDFLSEKLNQNVRPSTELAFYNPSVHPTPPYLPQDPSKPAPVLLRFNSPTQPVLELNTFFNGATKTESVNFAYGGATSGQTNVSDERVPGVLKQIDSYLQDSGQQVNAQALYAIWGGTNDFDPIAKGTLVNPITSVNNAETAISSLYNAGGRIFLILNMPDLGTRPFLDALPNTQSIQAEYSKVSDEYNELLAQRLTDLNQSLTNINLISVEVNDLLTFVRENSSFFGFTNTDSSFLSLANPTVANPDEYMFWDGEHPTRAAHKILGDFVYQTVEASTLSARYVRGTQESNILIGGKSNTLMWGGNGNDLILGGFGDDQLWGEAGDDLINGESGNDSIYGGTGNDRLNGSVGDDQLVGGSGNNFMVGGFGNDLILGGSGIDSLEGGRGNDTMIGGRGKDTYVFSRDLLDGVVDRDIIKGFEVGDSLDLEGYLSVGGSIHTQQLFSKALQLTLTNTQGIEEDQVLILGERSALAEVLITLKA